jgi:hypothetical protein
LNTAQSRAGFQISVFERLVLFVANSSAVFRLIPAGRLVLRTTVDQLDAFTGVLATAAKPGKQDKAKVLPTGKSGRGDEFKTVQADSLSDATAAGDHLFHLTSASR